MLKSGKYAKIEDVATWFINRVDRDSGDQITHLKLQKLLYYADAWYLANFNRPMVKEQFQAWAHGPVCKKIYDKYSGMSFEPLPREEPKSLPDKIGPFLAAVFDEYGEYSAKKLEKLTHDESPWVSARGDLRPEARSTKELDKLEMRNFYAGRLGKKPIKILQD